MARAGEREMQRPFLLSSVKEKERKVKKDSRLEWL